MTSFNGIVIEEKDREKHCFVSVERKLHFKPYITDVSKVNIWNGDLSRAMVLV